MMSDSQRRLVFAIFLYTCIEGLVVNFFYPNPIAYLPKDALIAMLYASLFLSGMGPAGSVARISGPFVIFAGVTFLFLAMPTPVSPIGLSVALKQRLFYIPLAIAGYHYVRGDYDVARLLRLIAWSSIPVSLFGMYLFFGGPYTLKDMGADYSYTFYSTMGASGQFFYRVPGTFNSPGQFGAYLLMVCVLLVGFLLVSDLSRKDRHLVLVALGCALPAMLASGSRTPMLLFLLLGGFTAMMSRELSRVGVIAGVVYVLLVGSLNYLGAGVADRFASIVSEENVVRAQSTLFGQLWITQMVTEPLGTGLATATVGARHFSPPGTVHLVESYLGILATETGIVGVTAFLGLLAAIVGRLWPARRWMRLAAARPIWNAGFLMVMATSLLTTNGTALDAIPSNLYFWFLVGMLLKMADLERDRLTALGTGGTS